MDMTAKNNLLPFKQIPQLILWIMMFLGIQIQYRSGTARLPSMNIRRKTERLPA